MREQFKDFKGGREEKQQIHMVHCGRAMKDADLVKSCRMSPEKLDGTVHLPRVYCTYTGIYLIALSHLCILLV